MGITAVYNRYRYSDEKRAALDAWSREIERCSAAARPKWSNCARQRKPPPSVARVDGRTPDCPPAAALTLLGRTADRCMTRKRGRPKGAGNFRHRAADRRDCLAIAALRLADPDLLLWQAIFRVTGAGGGWRHQDARARRLHRRYRSREDHYICLARLAARPRGSVTASDLTSAVRQITAARRCSCEEFEHAVRTIAEGREDLERAARVLAAGGLRGIVAEYLSQSGQIKVTGRLNFWP